MQTIVKAKKIGGSIGFILPVKLAEEERIFPEDFLEIRVKKIADLSFLWQKGKTLKKSTDKIMKEIDEGEE